MSGEGEKMPRRRMKGEERYRQLLDIATRMFAQHGYGKVGASDIARRAEVAEPTIYRHFESKRHLFLTTVRQAGQELLAEWRRVAQEAPTASAALKALARAFLRDLQERPHMVAMHMRAVEEADEAEARALARQQLLEVEGLLADLWERARAEGAVPVDTDPHALAWAVIGLGELALLAQVLDMWDVLAPEHLEGIWRRLSGLGT